MSVETELWTCEDGDLREPLPRSGDWDVLGDEFEGGGWLLTVSAPEGVATEEVPTELAALVDGLCFRAELSVEPSNPPPEAWALVREVIRAAWRRSARRGAGPRVRSLIAKDEP